MSVILRRGDNGKLDMYMYEADIARINKAQCQEKVTKVGLVPKIESRTYIRYDDWLNKYHDFLIDYVNGLYALIADEGIMLHYSGFKADMFRYIYDTSVSRYRGFTFLGN